MDPNTCQGFVDELQKIAAKKQEPNKKRSIAAGGAAVGGAALAAPHAKQLITGRTRLYHGTTAENAGSIQQKGLLPRTNSGAARGVTEILDPGVEQASRDLVFATPSKFTAKTYAAQAEGIQRHLKNTPMPETLPPGKDPGWFDVSPKNMAEAKQQQMQAAVGAARADPRVGQDIMNPFQKGVVKMDVPLWKMEQQGKLVANPEALGSYEEFHNAMAKKMGRNPEDPIFKMQTRASHRSLTKDSRVIKGGIGTEFVRGNKGFRGANLAEIGEYMKARPGRFAGGMALGAGALGLGAYGLHKLHQGLRRDHA